MSTTSVRRVLIVDDVRAWCDVLTSICNDCGAEAVCASSPAKALALLQGKTFDVVILDVVFSLDWHDTGGIDLLKLIRSNYAGVYTVVLTGFASTSQRDLVLKHLGADVYLSKGLESAGPLIERLCQIIRHKGRYSSETTEVT
jgi:CheY-like chemotaxis protein